MKFLERLGISALELLAATVVVLSIAVGLLLQVATRKR